MFETAMDIFFPKSSLIWLSCNWVKLKFSMMIYSSCCAHCSIFQKRIKYLLYLWEQCLGLRQDTCREWLTFGDTPNHQCVIRTGYWTAKMVPADLHEKLLSQWKSQKVFQLIGLLTCCVSYSCDVVWTLAEQQRCVGRNIRVTLRA